MGFSREWEDVYKRNEHQSTWPWSKLVSLAMRHSGLSSREANYRVLEIGCGAGANIAFFKHWNADYHAIEGSRTMVRRLQERFPELAGKLVNGDFTTSLGFPGEFDLIVDRASLTSNDTAAIVRCLRLIADALKRGGLFIGCDWYSDRHDQARKGVVAEDEYTRSGFVDGPFAQTGRVHFASKAHLLELFAAFELIHLEHVTEETVIGAERRVCKWQLVARKR